MQTTTGLKTSRKDIKMGVKHIWSVQSMVNNEHQPVLSIVRGLPGQGKSTFAKRYFPGVFHCENDMYHVIDGEYRFDDKQAKAGANWCCEMIEHALSHGCDAVVSNVFVSVNSIERYTKLAAKVGAKCVVYRMRTQYQNQHNVPANVLGHMKAGFADYPGEKMVDVNSVNEYCIE